VIELKQEGATDTPLRMPVEALAYACAVRKAWNEGRLRVEWAAAMEENGLHHEPEKILVRVPVILLASGGANSRQAPEVPHQCGNSATTGIQFRHKCHAAK